MGKSEIKWTPAQSLAIRKRGNTLVSAAAGSGKTAALTGKIVRLLTKSGARLDRMLVVTYSRAAAEELKVRIEKRLLELVASDPSAAVHINDLPGAQIGTIHSFCRKILSENYSLAGVSPGFSVMNEEEAKVVAPHAMEEAFDELFAAPPGSVPENSMGISGVCDVLGGIGEAEEAVKTLSGELASRGFSSDKLEEYALNLEKAADEDFFRTPWGAVYKDRIAEAARHFTNEIDRLTPSLEEEKFVTASTEFLGWLDATAKAASRGYSEFKRSFSPYSGYNPNKKKGDLAAARYQELKKEAEGFFKKTVGEKFALTQEQVSSAMIRTARFIRGLRAAIDAFGEKYAALKAERGKLDYQDLETFAYRLLVGEDGEPTKTAARIGEKYKFIFVDEYQDTNGVQDAIFRAIGKTSERFLVGDIKQSIYNFRGAEPEIFLGYRERWQSVFPDDDGEDDVTEPRDAGVFMSENFRCSEPIIRFVNGVSRYMFKNGGIPFDPGDELVFSSESEVKIPVSIDLVYKEAGVPSEEEYVADAIRGMIGKDLFGTGPLRPSDFAILTASANKDGPAFAEALAARGIPSSLSKPTDLSEESEMVLALDMLRAIDNPYRDGPLVGMMYSSVYGFSLDDLVRIRKKYSDGPFFTAVKRVAGEGAGEKDADLCAKCAAFCDRMEGYRLAERSSAADAFIEYLFSESGLAYAPEVTKKAEGTRNLRALLDLARRYEDGAFGGLYGFLCRIDDMIAAGSFGVSSSRGDAVNIMTIHKSKGLEFPVCFFSKTAKKPTANSDGTTGMLFDPELGAAAPLPDENGYTASKNPMLGAIAEKKRDVETRERMRKIYVALTRARSRLIVTAGCDPEKELAAADVRSLCDDAYSLRAAVRPIDCILPAALRSSEKIAEISSVGTSEGAKTSEEVATRGEECAREEDESGIAEARENFGFTYPYSYLSGLPAKLSVSRLYPEALDGDGAATLRDAEEEAADTRMPYPSFMTGTFDHTPAQRGTANHVFLQFADFEALRAGDVHGERERLVRDGFITREMADLVNEELIAAFASSDLSLRIAEAEDVRREFRFNVRLPAAEFTADPDLRAKFSEAGTKVTVQGVFDCVFKDKNGKLVLVDYKTDAMNNFEREHPDAFVKKLRERHRLQLAYYKEAAALLFGRVPDEVLVWSLAMKGSVDMTDIT